MKIFCIERGWIKCYLDLGEKYDPVTFFLAFLVDFQSSLACNLLVVIIKVY